MAKRKLSRSQAGAIGARITQHRYGTDHYRRMGERSNSLAIYGDSDAARSQRASDLGSKRFIIRDEGQEGWLMLLARRERQFQLPAGSLTDRPVPLPRTRATKSKRVSRAA